MQRSSKAIVGSSDISSYHIIFILCLYCTSCTQEAILLFLSRLADVYDTEEALVVGGEDVPLECVFDGCHGEAVWEGSVY